MAALFPYWKGKSKDRVGWPGIEVDVGNFEVGILNYRLTFLEIYPTILTEDICSMLTT